jgi:hypothetical protein
LTLYKFVQARRGLQSSNSGTNNGTGTGNGTANLTATGNHASAMSTKSPASGSANQDQVLGGTSRRQRNNDRWLIIRFTIAFVLLGYVYPHTHPQLSEASVY